MKPKRSLSERFEARERGSCPHRPPCPGCPRFLEPGIDPHAYARLSALCLSAGLPPPEVISGPALGFRHRARLAVRGSANSPKIGIFEAGTHRVVDAPQCAVHHPLINRVARVTKQVLRRMRVPPYCDETQLGLVRYLQVVVERGTQTAQVVVVANSENSGPLRSFLRQLAVELAPVLHSLWFNANTRRTNAILGERFELITGKQAVVERIVDADVHFLPGAFGQSNLGLFETIVRQIVGFTPEGRQVVEFYAGAGPIGLNLIERAKGVVFNEVAPASLESLGLSLVALPSGLSDKQRVVRGTAGDASEWVERAEIVIADPPRKGLDRALCARLCETPPERFIYVSCGLDSFLRDADQLVGSGRFSIRELRAFALFPFTPHVETLALFERR